MSDASLRRSEPMTVEGFLAFLDQRSGDEKWELIDGVPLMITGGTLHHARIGGNIDRLLGPAAERRGCMSLRGFLVEANEISSFEPDVMGPVRQPGWPKSPGAGPGDRVRGAVAV